MTDQHRDGGQIQENAEGRESRDSNGDNVSLWAILTTIRTNPLNNKCLTLPILRLDNPYSVNFHL